MGKVGEAYEKLAQGIKMGSQNRKRLKAIYRRCSTASNPEQATAPKRGSWWKKKIEIRRGSLQSVKWEKD